MSVHQPSAHTRIGLLLVLLAGCTAGEENIHRLDSDRPIVYTWFHTRPEGYRAFTIQTMDRDGSQPDTVFVSGDVEVGDAVDPPGIVAEQPAWSPSGEWIAFRGSYATRDDTLEERMTGRGRAFRGLSRHEIFIIRRDGSDLRQLTGDSYDNYNPDWSPDGRWIAYSSVREHGTDLFVVDTAGARIRRLTDRPGFDSAADWSPDGTRIVFASDRAEGRGAYIMDADGSNVRWLAAGTKPRWSPDGRRISFHARACEMLDRLARGDEEHCRATGRFGVQGDIAIWLIDPDGSNLKRVWPPNGETAPVRTADGRFRSGHGHRPLYPVWSPDGSELAFHAPRPMYATHPENQPAVDRLVERMWQEGEDALGPADFAWLQGNTFYGYVSVFVVDTSGVDAREVTFGGYGGGHPAWY